MGSVRSGKLSAGLDSYCSVISLNEKQMMTFTPLVDGPILHISRSAELENNINGPSLIRVPEWVTHPLGRYYLYFAHHAGRSIRMAFADRLDGPWMLYPGGVLQLADSHFPTTPPVEEDLHPITKRLIAQGIDGTYPHIASPDAIIDEEEKIIRLYYHGRLADGQQMTRVATSTDGLIFLAQPEILGRPYMRLFQYAEAWYGLAMPGLLYRSADGLTGFERGKNLFEGYTPRHFAVHKEGNRLLIFWTEIGDAPEQIKLSVLRLDGSWQDWQLENEVKSIRKPERGWEGSELPNIPSRGGAIYEAVNQLRDPAIYKEDGRLFLAYAIAGEQGIGIGELRNG